MILNSSAVDGFLPVYGDHTMSMHDFNIQTIDIEIFYRVSYAHVENEECTFCLRFQTYCHIDC